MGVYCLATRDGVPLQKYTIHTHLNQMEIKPAPTSIHKRIGFQIVVHVDIDVLLKPRFQTGYG